MRFPGSYSGRGWRRPFFLSVPVFFFFLISVFLSFPSFLPLSLPLFFFFGLSTFPLSLKSFSFLPPSVPVFSLLPYYKSMLVINTSKIQTINLLPGKQGKASPLFTVLFCKLGVYPSRYTVIYVCKIHIWGFFFYWDIKKRNVCSFGDSLGHG